MCGANSKVLRGEVEIRSGGRWSGAITRLKTLTDLFENHEKKSGGFHNNAKHYEKRALATLSRENRPWSENSLA